MKADCCAQLNSLKPLELKRILRFALNCSALLASLMICEAAHAQTFAVVPSSVNNTYLGAVTLQIHGLNSGESVVVQKYLDVNADGVVDAGDLLVQQYNLTDGQASVFTNGATLITNINVPGDTDTVAGQITSVLNFQGGDFTQNFVGQYLYVLSSPTGRWPAITNTFQVSNYPFPEQFSGTISSGGVPVPYAVVLIFQPKQGGGGGGLGQSLGGVVANNSGAYAIALPAGAYTLLPGASNYVASGSAAANITLATNQNLHTNLSLSPATTVISGQVLDATTPSIGLPGILEPATMSGIVAFCFTGSNGNFTLPVTSGQWGLGTSGDGLIVHGYLNVGNGTNVAAGTSGVILSNYKATALFYGVVTNSFGTPLVGYDVSDNDSSSTNFGSDGYTSSIGYYAVAALGSIPNDNWNLNLNTTNTYSEIPPLNDNGGINPAVGQAIEVDFGIFSTPYTISGYVTNSSGEPIEGVGVSACLTNGAACTGNSDTDSSGFYSIAVSSGTWSVNLNCCSTCGGNDYVPTNYICPNSDTVTVTSASVSNVDFDLVAAPYTISGYVTNEIGEGVANIGVSACSTNGAACAQADTDSSGFYSISVDSGMWSVCLNCCTNCGGNDFVPTNDLCPNCATLTVSNSSVANINFALIPAAALPQVGVFYGVPPLPVTNNTTNAINFGIILQNQTAPSVTFTVTNAGGETLQIGNLTVPPNFGLSVNPQNTIAPGSSTQFTVVMATTNVGTNFGYVNFTNNAGNLASFFSFPVIGIVTSSAVPQIQVTPNPAHFGTNNQFATGSLIAFTVTNAGQAALSFATPNLPAGYAFVPVAPLPAVLPAGSSTNFTVQLVTSNAGSFNGNISIGNNSLTPSYLIAVTGAVLSPRQIGVFNGASAITNGQTGVSFGSVGQNQTAKVTFTLTNLGGQTLNITNIAVPPGFALLTNSPLTLTNYPASVAGLSNGTFGVQLLTSNLGAVSGSIFITNNDPTLTNSVFSFGVTGTVVPPGPVIDLFAGATLLTDGQTNAVSFGTVLQGQAGSNITFTVSNAGSQTLYLTNISVPTGFALSAKDPTDVPAGSNFTFSVQLNTASEGQFSNNIVVSNNSAVNPFAFPVTGYVVGKIISVTGNLNFGVVPLGSSKPQTFTISNAGNTNLTINNITYPSAAFTANWTNGVITNGQSQQVTVTFTPSFATNYGGTITIVSDATSGASNSVVTAFGANSNLLLTIITNGQGRVTPNDAKLITQGKKVVLTATPAKGYVFAGWTGTANSTNNPLVFFMEESTVVEANFILNPYVPFAGIYNGLFWPSNGVVTETDAGMLKDLTLTAKGSYSATLLYDGASKGFSGSFDVAGTATKTLSMGAKVGTLDIVMNLTSNEPAPQITGTVSGSGWVSVLTADRATNVLPSAEYTLLVPPDTNSTPPTGSPGGDGYALITNSAGNPKNPATANAKITGALADGTTFNETVPVSEDGFVPIYASLYHNSGLILGWINLNLTNTNALSYTGLMWIHPAAGSGLYTEGFTNIIESNQLLLAPWTNTLPSAITVTNLELLAAMTNTNALANFAATVSANGKIGPAPLSGTINPKTGYFTVTWGSGAHKTNGYGVILFNGTNGGFYLTKTNAQALQLQP